MRTLAFSRSGNVTSTSLPLTTAATAAFASRGEICAATSPGVDPADTRRLEPSGSVTEISDIVSCGEAVVARLRSLPTPRCGLGGRVASYGAQPSQWLASRSSRSRLQARAKVGRHERTRTADLLRVKQAL